MRYDLVRNFGYPLRLEPSQEALDLFRVEKRVAGLDTQEEAVARGALEAGRVEHGVIGHGKAAQGEQPEGRRNGREKHGQLEGDHDVGRPAKERTPADIGWEIVYRDVPLQKEACQTATNAAEQYDERELAFLQMERMVQFLDWERRVSLHIAISAV